MSPLVRIIAALLAMSLAACGSSETSTTSTPLPLADSGTGDVSALDSGAAARTIQQRAVFGALDPANKLHDGDFELSAGDGVQYPWFRLEQKMIVTGAQCLSGLRCVKLEPGEFIAGAFVWPDATYAEASFWTTSSGASCEQDAPGFIWQVDSTDEPTPLPALTAAPQDGWCQYGGVVKVDSSYGFYTLALARHHEATGAMLFDKASVLPRTEPPANLRSLRPLSESDARVIATMRRHVPEVDPRRPSREPRAVRNPTGRRNAIRVP